VKDSRFFVFVGTDLLNYFVFQLDLKGESTSLNFNLVHTQIEKKKKVMNIITRTHWKKIFEKIKSAVFGTEKENIIGECFTRLLKIKDGEEPENRKSYEAFVCVNNKLECYKFEITVFSRITDISEIKVINVVGSLTMFSWLGQ